MTNLNLKKKKNNHHQKKKKTPTKKKKKMGKEHDELDEAPPITTRQEEINKVLFFLMLAQSIVFTEAGSIPALLIPLTEDFNLTFPQQGESFRKMSSVLDCCCA